MSSELVHVDQTSHTFDLIGHAASLADRIARTDFVPTALKGKPEAVMAAMLKGHELGMAPMQALSHIAIIQGKPTVSAEGQRALVLARGHDISVKEMTPAKCVLVGTRAGQSEGTTVSYSMDDAKRAGINRGATWNNYPREMLLARCTTLLCKAVFPDVTGGLHSTEEAADMEHEGEDPATVTRKAPARRKTATKAEPDPAPSAPLPPLPHEVDDEIVDAEVVVDDPGEPLITDAQTRKMVVCFKDAGITDRAERLAYVADHVGRTVESSKELTKAEASSLIDELETVRAAQADTPS